MSRYDVILSVGFKDGDVNMAISMDAAELSDAAADDIRGQLAKAVERFDDFRRSHPRTEKPKKFWPHVIDGGR